MRNWNKRLFLGPLPRSEAEIDDLLNDLEQNKMSWIVTLLSDEEMQEKSPEFARWRAAQGSYDTRQLPIPDRSVPETRSEIELFWDTVLDVGELIEENEQRVYLHCAAGIGRTGTFAVAVLQGLGFTLEEALTEIRACGSEPETKEQHAMLAAGPPALMLHNRKTYGFDWRPDQKALTREIIERVDVAAFTVQLGRPNKGCMLNHLDGKTGYIALQDAISDSYRVFDYDTDGLLGSYPDIDTLVNSGWKVST